ncbi:MAG: sarcosine oxidase subunit alpha family protein [Alphaproteobacteria bacterium]|nr:sarcosine oxidase subunit alpha family protein [Alphaproteobacteria bacterium]
MSRLAKGGLIARDRPVRFRFDGRELTGFEGDTLASALLAHDVRLVGRSFKYHRPRGILCAGSEEPNALVKIGEGGASTPNIRATTQEIYQGLIAHSQNRFPSLRFDLMAVNDLMAPFFSAGFYYKTFMWPAAFWERFYEPMIRRAAGLGALSGAPDLARYDKGFAYCDLLIIGAGPAGLMAALAAGRAGLDVLVADEDFEAGGRLNSETLELDGAPARDWLTTTLAELSSMENVRLMTRTTVTGAYDGGIYGAVERVSHHLGDAPDAVPLEVFWRITARRVILASGAIERPIAFADNDRPGIMMASAVRSYVNRFAVAPGRDVSIFTNNDEGLRTARDLVAAGIGVVAVIDTRADVAADDEFLHLRGAEVIATKGRLGLREITVRASEQTRGQTRGQIQRIKTDCLVVSGGWNPSVHLSCHLGARPVWREDIAAFIAARGAVPGMVVAGAACGEMSAGAALGSGLAAAKTVMAALGGKVARLRAPKAGEEGVKISAFWHVRGGKGRAWLDFSNDVTVKDVALAHRENFRSVEHMKRYTTLGMAPDQGKLANMGALAVMADLTGRSVPETGTTTFRPPYTPVSMGVLGAHGRGVDFAPVRRVPSHELARELGAEMVEAGLWMRPAWYPRAGESHWRQSCDREALMVRQRVGISDVTSLGKIDVQGPDAAVFLDRVYANMISTLKVGRVRYAVMLREDGMVLDDGTVARFGARHFVVTTTTAAAGEVLRHLDFCAQVLWPDLDVMFTSVTEQWAQFAVAGPKSRELMSALCDAEITDEAFAFMGCGEVRLGSLVARLFRISFSGERAYEIAVPAEYGDGLVRLLDQEAARLGGGWYGMEALNVLRLEKGYVTHAELDGRVTADDVGLGAMVSAKKDCVGKVMSQREGLVCAERLQLVGLKPAGASKQLLGGAHLFNLGDEPVRQNDQGHITSQCFSPHLGHPIAQAMVLRGRSRIGETVRMVDHLREVQTLCEICSPVFIDPDGGRLRG